MSWKVGDQFWIDYDKMLENKGEVITETWKTHWFPLNLQPFIIEDVKRDEVRDDRGYVVDIRFIYNKSMIINKILEEL